MKIKAFFTISFSFIVLLPALCAAEVNPVSEFKAGSYKSILDNQAGKPFVLVIWSLTCSSCIKDMALLDEMHQKHPDLALVMLSTDEPSDSVEIRAVLEKNHLAGVAKWVFAEEDAQKLRFEIDPSWYGEMPRTYFFDKYHNRTGISGALSSEDFTQHIERIVQ